MAPKLTCHFSSLPLLIDIKKSTKPPPLTKKTSLAVALAIPFLIYSAELNTMDRTDADNE
jgi:hypothetical protein